MPRKQRKLPTAKRTPLRTRIRRHWRAFLAVAAVVSALVAFRNDVLQLIRDGKVWIEKRKVETSAAKLRRRTENLLSVGSLEDARVGLRKAFEASSDTSYLKRNADYVLSERLVDGFTGPRTWDQKSTPVQKELLNELRAGPATPLQAQLCTLLVYRVENHAPTPGAFFRGRERTLKVPFVRLLAARESHNSEPQWSIGVLRGVLKAARRLNLCALELRSLVWLAKSLRRAGENDSALAVDSTLATTPECNDVDQGTVEVDYWGERLKHGFAVSDSGIVMDARSQLEGIHRSATLRRNLMVRFKANYYLAWDAHERDRFRLESELSAAAISLFQENATVEKAYPYHCAQVLFFLGEARLGEGDLSDSVASALSRSAFGFGELSADSHSGGPYYYDEANSRLMLALFHAKRGETLAGKSDLRAVDSVWTLMKDELTPDDRALRRQVEAALRRDSIRRD